MTDFHAGFARVNITPAMGIPIAGYFQVRLANTVLDELECNVLAASVKGETVLLISCDIIGMARRYHDPICTYIAGQTGIPADHILITCTHTHTGPMLDGEIVPDMQADYYHFLKLRMLRNGTRPSNCTRRRSAATVTGDLHRYSLRQR